MGQVTVQVAGKSYVLGCADGEEDRLKELAGDVDGKVSEIGGKLGSVGESRLLLMAAILLADDKRVLSEGGSLTTGIDEESVAAMLDQIASDVETIADGLASP